LASIIKHDPVIEPYIDTTYFPETLPDFYWSSTSRSDGGIFARAVQFLNGRLIGRYKTSQLRYVRCVKDGP
jgi:hypothetical protein